MKFFVQYPIRTSGRCRRTISVFALICLVPALLQSTSIYAQNDAGANTVIDRYGNLDIERAGPTIDANLAQKLYRRGNTYSNLQRYTEAIEEYRRAISANPTTMMPIRHQNSEVLYQAVSAGNIVTGIGFTSLSVSTTVDAL